MEKFIIIAVLFWMGCAAGPPIRENSLLINTGQTKANILEIMGPPGDRQFSESQEAWQYCHWYGADYEYLLIWFNDGKVTGLQTFKIDGKGGCQNYFKTIKWKEAPDKTIEIRNR